MSNDKMREALEYCVRQVPELATVPGVAEALAAQPATVPDMSACFMTAESGGGEYKVVLRFQTLAKMQDAHSAMIHWLAAAPKPEQPATVPEGMVLVPVEPTEEMWGGLARDLMMWLDFGNPTVEALREHLNMLGREWPAWMDAESEMKGSGVPSKGTRATLIYKAMLAAAPAPSQDNEGAA